MSTKLDIDGIVVDLRTKESLVKVITGMNKAVTTKLKNGEVKTNAKRNAEEATLSFFGSIIYHLSQ